MASIAKRDAPNIAEGAKWVKWPAVDERGLVHGEPLDVRIRVLRELMAAYESQVE